MDGFNLIKTKKIKNMGKTIACIACLLAAVISASAAEGIVKKIWPDGKMPGTACKEQEAFKIFRNKDKRINFVSTPTLEFFLAGGDNPSGLVIVCPGGAYKDIWYVNEGTEIAERLSKAGLSCAVLKYRIPDNTEGALMDIQRAIRYARANAKELNINPGKIGVMGFSAGANLSARASAADKAAYMNVDGADEISCKPDCTVLVYPAYCDQPTYDWRWNGKSKPENMDYSAQFELAKDLKINSSTPPAFIVQTQDDKTYIDASIAYYLALKKSGVPAELFLFSKGGHGFCLNNQKDRVKVWINLCEDWLKEIGFSADK